MDTDQHGWEAAADGEDFADEFQLNLRASAQSANESVFISVHPWFI
jgi:hypothetical protein